VIAEIDDYIAGGGDIAEIPIRPGGQRFNKKSSRGAGTAHRPGPRGRMRCSKESEGVEGGISATWDKSYHALYTEK